MVPLALFVALARYPHQPTWLSQAEVRLRGHDNSKFRAVSEVSLGICQLLTKQGRKITELTDENAKMMCQMTIYISS